MSKHPAITFLQTLDPRPEATFNIEHYTDLPKGEVKPNLEPLAWRYSNLSISEVMFDALPDMALIQLRPLMNFKVVPYSATTIWRKCRTGEFPAPIKVSAGITAWRVGDIREYLISIAKPTGGAAI